MLEYAGDEINHSLLGALYFTQGTIRWTSPVTTEGDRAGPTRKHALMIFQEYKRDEGQLSITYNMQQYEALLN